MNQASSPRLPRWWRRQSLRLRLAMTATLVVMALLVLGGGLFLQHFETSYKASLFAQQYALVRQVAESLEQNLQLNEAALRQTANHLSAELAGQTATPAPTPSERGRYLQQYLESRVTLQAHFDDLILTAADFKVLADVPRLPGRTGRDVADLKHLQRLMATGQPVISEPFLGRVTGEPMLAIAVPVFDAEGRVMAALAGTLRLSRPNLIGQLAGRKVGQSGHFAASTAERVLIVSRFKEKLMQPGPAPGQNLAYDRALAGWEGTEEVATSYGQRVVMSYARVKSPGWVLGGLLPVEEAYAPMWQARGLFVGYLVLALGLVGGVMWWLVGWLLAPLVALRQHMQSLRASPDLSARVAVGPDEIGALASDFYALFDELQTVHAETRAQAAQLQSIIDASPLAICFIRERMLLSGNPAFERIFGYALHEVLGQSVSQFYLSPEAFVEFGAKLYPAIADGGVARFEVPFRHRSGRVFWTHFYSRLLDPADPTRGAVVLIEDITDLKQALDGLKLSAQVIESSAEGIFITDQAHRLLSVNPAFCRITGYGADEVLGKTSDLLISSRHEPAFLEAVVLQLRADGHWQGEVWGRRRNGEEYPGWLMLSQVRNEDGIASHEVGVFSDISERKAAEARIRHLAEHDTLTELPNRALLQDRLAQALHQGRRSGGLLALLFIDLDRFKNINDSLGHTVGDGLLCEVARRIVAEVRASDTVSRPGGDEFVVLLAAIDDVADAARIADKLLESLRRPCQVAGHELVVTASIGISIFPGDGDDAQTLLRHADTAMYHSKESGRNVWHFFMPEMNARVFERMSLEHELRRALAAGEFLLHYQPQVNSDNGRLIGLEALVRWQHPERGLVPPDQFIPVAEDCGLILALGDWVLHEACRQNSAWQAAGLPAVPVAVNFSALQLRQPGLGERINHVLASTGLEPGCLELELTESAMMAAGVEQQQVLLDLQAVGVRVSIDDFGTGYSSLAYLKRLPLNKLKIDRAFVRDIATDPDDAAIIAAIIDLARNLRLAVIAEGVEDGEQLEFLRQRGCREVQGYYYSRPLPAVQLEAWWRQHLG